MRLVATNEGAWIVGWRLRFDERTPDSLKNWLCEDWRVFDAGHLPTDALAVVLPGSAGDGAGAAEPRSRRILTVDDHELALEQRADEYLLEGADGGCRFSMPSSGLVQVLFWGARPHVPVYTALSEIFRASGWISVHASGIVTDGPLPGAHMHLGRSGAGKSFKLLECIAGGAQPIGEDRIWLCADDFRVAARDDAIRINDDGFSHFGWLSREAATTDHDGKYRIRYEALEVVPALPSPLVSYAILGREPVRSPIDRAAILWEAVGLPFTPQGRTVAAKVVNRLMAMHRPEAARTGNPTGGSA